MAQHLTVKELPINEKPYEKCIKKGAEFLSDSELLAVIIRTGSQGIKSTDLANSILKECGESKGLSGLFDLSINRLKKIKGIGDVKAVQIKCICELSKRISKSQASNNLYMNSPQTIAAYYMEELRHEQQEQLVIAMFNTKNALIADKVISKGTVDCSIISPREIFIEALKREAVNLVIIHNHPSGDVTPSKEDLHTTKRLKECGALIGISVIDHIIIGDNKYLSFNERGLF